MFFFYFVSKYLCRYLYIYKKCLNYVNIFILLYFKMVFIFFFFFMFSFVGNICKIFVSFVFSRKKLRIFIFFYIFIKIIVFILFKRGIIKLVYCWKCIIIYFIFIIFFVINSIIWINMCSCYVIFIVIISFV